jgi:hypothetical protein
MGTDSDYGALLAKNAELENHLKTARIEIARLETEQGREIGKLKSRTSTPKMVALGTLLVSLAGTPMAVELTKPDPPPAATKHDIEALRREIAALRDYLQQKHGADEQRWRVVTSALDRSGFRVRGMSKSGVQWRSKNARAEEFEAQDDLGRYVAIPDYPLPPQ